KSISPSMLASARSLTKPPRAAFARVAFACEAVFLCAPEVANAGEVSRKAEMNSRIALDANSVGAPGFEPRDKESSPLACAVVFLLLRRCRHISNKRRGDQPHADITGRELRPSIFRTRCLWEGLGKGCERRRPRAAKNRPAIARAADRQA